MAQDNSVTPQTRLTNVETKVDELLSKVKTLEHYNTGDLAQNIHNFNIEFQKNLLSQVSLLKPTKIIMIVSIDIFIYFVSSHTLPLSLSLSTC
jgi:hypothetical protein